MPSSRRNLVLSIVLASVAAKASASCVQIDLNPPSPTLSIAHLGVAYSQTFTQSGAVAPVTFTANNTSPDLTFNPSTATLSGTPSADGTFWINVTVSGANGCRRTRKYKLVVPQASLLAPAFLSAGPGSVLEPDGSPQPIKPAWFNTSSNGVSFTGHASDWSGPGDATYSILSTLDAVYGMGPGITGDCTPNCHSVSVAISTTRPAVHWDATFAELLNGGNGFKPWTVHVGHSFTDVAINNVFYAFIETLLHNGVTGGCTTTAFCPGNEVTRAQIAVFLLRSKEGPAYVPPPYTGIFTDVPNDFFGPWIEELSRRGITGGCGPSTYCPSASVTRAQMAVFLIRTVEGNAYTPPPYAGLFADVPDNAFAPFIEELSRRGITGGCGGSNYCPNDPVVRSQMAVFLTRTFGLLLYGP